MTQSAQAPVPIGNTIDSLGRQPGALGLVVPRSSPRRPGDW